MTVRYTSVDSACEELRKIALRDGLDRIELSVRADGRVTIAGGRGIFTKWVVEADALPGGSLQYPSAAICDALEGDAADRLSTEQEKNGR